MIKKQGPIAILTHWRTGSTLLRSIFVACGMSDCVTEFEYEYGDINGVGNCLYNKFKMTQEGVPAEIVANALRMFKEKAEENQWKHYGIKIDHALQAPCWNAVGSQFEENWPNARFVISIRHPDGIIRSIAKLRALRPLAPDFTAQDILDSWLSTYESTKHLINEGALVVCYPDSHILPKNRLKSGVHKLITRLGMEWTEEASSLFEEADSGENMIIENGSVRFTDDANLKDNRISDESYRNAIAIYEEFKRHAIT